MRDLYDNIKGWLKKEEEISSCWLEIGIYGGLGLVSRNLALPSKWRHLDGADVLSPNLNRHPGSLKNGCNSKSFFCVILRIM
jgi:hypothetical protein